MTQKGHIHAWCSSGDCFRLTMLARLRFARTFQGNCESRSPSFAAGGESKFHGSRGVISVNHRPLGYEPSRLNYSKTFQQLKLDHSLNLAARRPPATTPHTNPTFPYCPHRYRPAAC